MSSWFQPRIPCTLHTAFTEAVPSVLVRQWPEVYDLCHTFLHVAPQLARVKKPTAMRESRANKCDKI